MKDIWEALKRLEKAADRILGRRKKGTKSWTSEIRQPDNENYAIAIISASPYSSYFEWKVIVVDQKGKALAALGAETNLEAAKEKVKTKVENLYIWNIEGSPLNWNPPLETADALFAETFKGYKRWEVGGYLIVMRQISRDKVEVEVVDPVKSKTYHRNVGNVGEENKLFGGAVDYIGRHLLGRELKVEEITEVLSPTEVGR